MKPSRYHFHYEFISLMRSRWLQFLSVILLALCLFAAYNGKQKVNQRITDIREAQAAVQEKDSIGVILLDSIEAGYTVNVPVWYMPDQPNVIGNYYLRVATMPPAELAVIATGQSDIYTHYVKPTLYGESFQMNFTELSSPVQLMFGSFDLSFVLIYLLPLIVIAFTYNILSSEREQGALFMIAAQPVSVFQWLLQKALLRYLVLAGILMLVLLIALLVGGASLVVDFGKTLTFLVLALGYLLFWVVLAFLVNLAGKSSASNAVSLLAFWIVLVLLLPATISQLANTLYPVPSRARLINELRVVNAEAEKKANELLADFLRDHPELSGFEGGSAYWQKYFASQDLIRKEIQPVLAEYDEQLQRQQQWVDGLRFISPALLLQDAFNEIACTSTRHYEDYRRQVAAFSEMWQDHFLSMIFRGEAFTKTMMTELPEFTYQPSNVQTHSTANTLALLCYCALMLGGGALWYSSIFPKMLVQT